MIVKCPYCLKVKTINETDKNKQVRCSLRDGGCGKKYYIRKNTVLNNETIKVSNINGEPINIDLSILRAFYRIFTTKSHRGTKQDLIGLIILYLRSELGKL